MAAEGEDAVMAAEAEAVAMAAEVAVVMVGEAGGAATAVARAVPVATTTAAKSNPSIANGAGFIPRPVFFATRHFFP